MAHNIFTFLVDRNATKWEIKVFFERYFHIYIEKIRMVSVGTMVAKWHKKKKSTHKENIYKKAYVKLDNSYQIDYQKLENAFKAGVFNE